MKINYKLTNLPYPLNNYSFNYERSDFVPTIKLYLRSQSLPALLRKILKQKNQTTTTERHHCQR